MSNRNISIASKNGYTLEKVMKAKQYLDEIGNGRRTFPFEKLVGYYNELFNTHEPVTGCKCQSPKYYNGIQNFYKYGKLTLINNGLASEEDFKLKENKPEEVADNRIDLGEEIVSDALKDDDIDSTKEEAKEEVIEEKNEVIEKPKKGRPKKN